MPLNVLAYFLYQINVEIEDDTAGDTVDDVPSDNGHDGSNDENDDKSLSEEDKMDMNHTIFNKVVEHLPERKRKRKINQCW